MTRNEVMLQRDNLLGMTSLGNSRKNRGRPIRPQITRGTKSGEADRSRPCEARGISFRKSYAAFSPFLYECLYVCCCRTRNRARDDALFFDRPAVALAIIAGPYVWPGVGY